ncbi:hypothetical protein [Endozoicomonas sp. SCSIO W0465]|uniref:hypothetical protein n=1 Tax=Endozoicomonas sp. SCSIO W0465 TaxID=2918516 RepID=UPI0020753F75|nr:hypothetical protein [Endozoicomonas sp. SCSIO W0465]USE37229.1 hypothetical protein MJO57_03075 [Endozoicomonas sp. SCSIO W0465]
MTATVGSDYQSQKPSLFLDSIQEASEVSYPACLIIKFSSQDRKKLRDRLRFSE